MVGGTTPPPPFGHTIPVYGPLGGACHQTHDEFHEDHPPSPSLGSQRKNRNHLQRLRVKSFPMTKKMILYQIILILNIKKFFLGTMNHLGIILGIHTKYEGHQKKDH